MLRTRRSASRASCCPTGGRCRTAAASRLPQPSTLQPTARSPGGQSGPRYGAPLAIQLPRAAEPGHRRAVCRRRSSITATARILEQKYRFKADKTTSGYGLKTAVHAPTTRRTRQHPTTTTRRIPAIGMSHIAARPAGGRGVDGAAQERQQHAADQVDDGAEDRRHRREGELPLQSTSSQDTAAGERRINCASTSPPTSAPATLGSSRVFSDPAKSAGPVRRDHGRRRAAASTSRTTTAASAAPAPSFIVAIVIAGLTPAGRGRGVHRRRRPHHRRHHARRHSVVLSLDPKSNAGTQDALIKQRRRRWASRRSSCSRAAASSTCRRWYASAQAVVMAWYPGMVGGIALGRLLFGDATSAASSRSPGTPTLDALADVRDDSAARRRWTTTSATATSTRRDDAHARRRAASRSGTACRTRRSATRTCRCRARR